MLQFYLIVSVGLFLATWRGVKRAKLVNVASWKIVATILFLFVAGMMAGRLWAYIEEGIWGGLLLYGPILTYPVTVALFALVIRAPYGHLMDFSAVAVCIFQIFSKVNCYLVGCCAGRVLFARADGTLVYFPSQFAEALAMALMLPILFIMDEKGTQKNVLYGWFLLMMGSTRFILQCFRAYLVPFLFGLSGGHVWSILSVILGVIWIFIARKYNAKKAAAAAATETA